MTFRNWLRCFLFGHVWGPVFEREIVYNIGPLWDEESSQEVERVREHTCILCGVTNGEGDGHG